mmetsp:Transcript_68/g.158  ORF Transcript_68/g.158 Transcript_68/m.158 type:complete len:206 (-) Transcript_68:310-927(-)
MDISGRDSAPLSSKNASKAALCAASSTCTNSSGASRWSRNATKVKRKLDTIVATPILAEMASKRAISARLSPGNCWRVSAQNHCQIGPRAARCIMDSARAATTGRAKAAPISKQANRAKAAISPCATSAKTIAPSNNAAAAPICKRSRRPEAITQARGRTLASKGIRAICQMRPAKAAAVPSTAINRPDSHHSARNCKVPDTCAP